MSETIIGHTTILSILANHLPEWIQESQSCRLAPWPDCRNYFDLALPTSELTFDELGWQVYCFPSIQATARLQYVLQQAIASLPGVRLMLSCGPNGYFATVASEYFASTSVKNDNPAIAIAGALAEYLTQQQVFTPEGLFPVLRQTSTTVTVLLDNGTAKDWLWDEVMPPLSEQAQEQAIAAVVED